ncbi:hypothetical protein [Pseudoxanthomonas mexicana]
MIGFIIGAVVLLAIILASVSNRDDLDPLPAAQEQAQIQWKKTVAAGARRDRPAGT